MPRYDMNDYQKDAVRTLIEKVDFQIEDHEMMLLWNVMGIGGEAGEIVDQVKKGVFHQHGIDRDELVFELGDLLWYVACTAHVLDLDLNTIMNLNIDKLKNRYPEGYSSEDSKNRWEYHDTEE